MCRKPHAPHAMDAHVHRGAVSHTEKHVALHCTALHRTAPHRTADHTAFRFFGCFRRFPRGREARAFTTERVNDCTLLAAMQYC